MCVCVQNQRVGRLSMQGWPRRAIYAIPLITGYSSGRGPRSKRAISRSAQSHMTTATKDGAQTERHFVRVHSQKEWATLYE